MSLQGEQEAMDKERREAPEREVMRAAWPADKGWVSPLQDRAALCCSAHLHLRPTSGPWKGSKSLSSPQLSGSKLNGALVAQGVTW